MMAAAKKGKKVKKIVKDRAPIVWNKETVEEEFSQYSILI